ncbi:SHOCT-like domain-containing protein [Niallia sp. HCP3S3_B10]|uniref:SHOCT-like domain-containing protein n=1 Tax=Niallia sp. HCP3S3_B10 TaxID=3438944 RepID=UPI003F8B55A0
MNDEIRRILTMVENGKLTSDQAAVLIHSFEEKIEKKQLLEDSPYLNRLLKVRVHSETNDNININVPIRLVKVLLQTGIGIASKIPQAQTYTENIDVELLLAAIDSELVGEIVNAKLANGDSINIYVE